MVQWAHRRGVFHVCLILNILTASFAFGGEPDASRPTDPPTAESPAEEPPTAEPPAITEGTPELPIPTGIFTRRRMIGCGVALAIGAVLAGGWLLAPSVLHDNTPIKLDPDHMKTPPTDPRAAAAELRELLAARGGTLRIGLTDSAGDTPVLRLFEKTRLQRVAADKIKAAIQKRNPNVDGSEIGVGEAGMVIRVRYFEMMLMPDGMVRLAVGGTTWRLESSRSYAPEDLLNGSAHQMDFGPHVEIDPQATATFRAGFLLRFDAKTRTFVVPHAKCTMKVDARPFLNDEDSGEIRDVTSAEVR